MRQERRPDKRLYRITPQGEQALRRWLDRPEVEPDVIKSTFLLKLFFGGMMSRETLVAQIEERRSQAEQTLAELEAIEQRIKDDDGYTFPYLTLRSGIAHGRARLDWAEEMLQELEGDESQFT